MVGQEVGEEDEKAEGVVRAAEAVEHEAVVLLRDHRDVRIGAATKSKYV